MPLEYHAQRDAAAQLEVSEQTAIAWFDKLGGPRDSSGRRVWTSEMIDRVRAARLERFSA